MLPFPLPIAGLPIAGLAAVPAVAVAAVFPFVVVAAAVDVVAVEVVFFEPDFCLFIASVCFAVTTRFNSAKSSTRSESKLESTSFFRNRSKRLPVDLV